MAVWQRTMGDSKVVLPVEARAVDLAGNSLAIEDSGAVMFMLPPPGTAEYRVGLGSSPLIPAPPPGAVGAELDLNGVSPEISVLAADVIGDGDPFERIARVEKYLRENYGYTLELGSQPTDRPVERFLFETRQGHCEYFVSAMVLMLRSQGIPARVVTGYLGADYNDWQQYFIVRQSHAHAWVEAWVEDAGWQIFDPTPGDGRPTATRSGMGALLEQAWDSLLFRWDRYVLTYGFYDQVGAFIRIRELLDDLWRFFADGDESERAAAEPAAASDLQASDERERSAWITPQLIHAAPFVVIALAAALWFWWQRERMTATAAFRQLRARLVRAAPEIADSTPPLEVGRLLASHLPDARPEAHRVVELYLEESFGGRKLRAEELAEVREALREAGRKWKKTG